MNLRFLLPLALLPACAGGPDEPPPPPPDPPAPEEVEAATARAEEAATTLFRSLMSELERALGGNDSALAIAICAQRAPALAAELSEVLDLEVGRTSLHFRNPANAPDPYERAWLELAETEYDGGRGTFPDADAEVVLGAGRYELRYLKPIRIAPNCLRCHGERKWIDPAIREQLAELYPGDRATGYSTGDLRGAISVLVPFD